MISQLESDFKKLLEIKKELLIKMLNTVRQAAELLGNNDMDAFSEKMEGCKEISESVDDLDKTIKRLKGKMPESKSESVKKIKEEIEYIIGQIDDANVDCNNIAQQKLSTYVQQIQKIKQTKRGINGYTGQVKKRDALFIDEKK